MTLPVVATVEVQGEPVVVRAAPLSLVAKLVQAGTAAPGVVLQIVARCCSFEGGAPLDPDTLSMESAARLVRLAVGEDGGADFPSRPASREPGG